MLLENPLPVGTRVNDDAEIAHFPKVRRFMTDQEYYDLQRAEREAENARFLGEAEPVVTALERRLHQEHLLAHVLVETGVKEEVLRGLLDRRAPSRNPMQGFSESAWREALAALAEWLAEDKQRRKAATADHAPTPTMKAIYSILTEAMDFGLLDVTVGGVGIGKSRAAEILVSERPRTHHQPGAILVEVRTADKTVHACIEYLIQRLRNDSNGRGGYSELCRLLRRGDLLILDEAQRLTTCGNGAMIEVVRDLWKETGAGIALLGNPDMKKRRSGVVGNDLYAAFMSRAHVHDFNKGTTREDVEAWMLWKGLSGKALADRLVALATNPSGGEYVGLRALQKLVEATQRRLPGEPLTAPSMLESLRLMVARS